MSLEAKYYEAPEFWSDGVLTNAGNMRRIERTVGIVPGSVRSLLDVGCGNGVFANLLQTRRPDIAVTATDRSSAALAHVHTRRFASDIVAIPCPDRSFDCVSCLQVLEHIRSDNYASALAELARLSREYLLIGVPFDEDLLRDFTRCPTCLAQFNLNMHLRRFDHAAIHGLFREHGFDCVTQQNIDPVSVLHGQDVYRKLCGALRRPRARFDSPLCPVCGYENARFETPIAHATQQAREQHLLKRIIKRVWPSYLAPGYWSIALYERRT